MKLTELKKSVEKEYPEGIDKLGYPAVDDLRLQQLVDLLERGNPEYTANIRSIDISPFAFNSYYQPDDPNIRLGLTTIPPGTAYGTPSRPADIIRTLVHEITHSLVPTDSRKVFSQGILDPTVHRQLLGQPGGGEIPSLNKMFRASYNAQGKEIPSNIMGWALSRYLFPEQSEQPHKMHPAGYNPVANEVVRIMQLSDYARRLAEQGLP